MTEVLIGGLLLALVSALGAFAHRSPETFFEINGRILAVMVMLIVMAVAYNTGVDRTMERVLTTATGADEVLVTKLMQIQLTAGIGSDTLGALVVFLGAISALHWYAGFRRKQLAAGDGSDVSERD